MILAIVIMNMVYLISETRVKVGERGINDPPVKVAVTMLTYLGIFLIQVVAPPPPLTAVSPPLPPSLSHLPRHLPHPDGCTPPRL